MFRRAVTSVSLVSLAVSMVLEAMWVRSYCVSDVWEWRRVTRDEQAVYSWYAELTSGGGGIGLSRDAEAYDARYARVRDVGPAWSFAGRTARAPGYPQPVFHFGLSKPAPAFALRWDGRGAARREVIVPYWAVVLPLAAAGTVGAKRAWSCVRARRRRRAGACAACGYDLRATPERCPECGAANPTAGAKAGAGG